MLQEFALNAYCEIRRDFGFPFICNRGALKLRGYRSFKENRTIPGHTDFSRHMQSIAFDTTPKGTSLHSLLSFLQANFRSYGVGGIGFYPNSNFIHIDFRPLTGPKPVLWVL
jgi:hypothetical protein